MSDEPTWIHIQVQDPDLVQKLDEMVKEEESDRSKFVRKLIRQEYARRKGEIVHEAGRLQSHA